MTVLDRDCIGEKMSTTDRPKSMQRAKHWSEEVEEGKQKIIYPQDNAIDVTTSFRALNREIYPLKALCCSM